jgi:Zn-dependent protease/CBS domain-containing protein
MKWSWKIARVGGIDLRVHATFVILLVWLAIVYFRELGTVAGAATGVFFTLALFASVVLHEFGHALTARRFGVPTRDITLLPIGGVARLEYIPDKPKQELQIALAGPAVTLVIALTLYVVLRVLGLPAVVDDNLAVQQGGGAFVAQLMWVNVTLLLFNLLPAFPMDGGRVLRAALALRMKYLRATMLAARVGKVFALLFGVVGLLYNPLLVLIALFVWLGAASESSTTQMHSVLSGVNVERVMIRDIRTLAPGDTLDTALHHVLEGFQTDFPVVENDNVVGVLTRAGLLAGLAGAGREAPVANSMEKSFRTADSKELVETAIARLGECKCRTLPVLSDGRLTGLLTMDNVGEYVMIEAALRSVGAGARSSSSLRLSEHADREHVG